MASFNIEAVHRITALSLRKIRYWDQTGLVRPSVQAARGRGSRRLYSFEDLVELRTIARLRAAGISLQRVHRVVKYLHKVYAEIKRPLSNLRLLTDGKTVFVRSDEARLWADTLAGGQIVFIVPVDEVWRETEAKVHDLGSTQRGQIKIGRAVYDVTYEPDLEDGGWIAECSSLPGCASQGDTLTEARRMIRDAIGGWLDAQSTETRDSKSKAWGR